MTKKILHIVHTEASCGWGGQEIRILSESEGMIAKGHQVTLLCSDTAPILNAARERGIPAVGLPLQKKTLKGLLAVRNWLKAHPDVDVVNPHSSTDSWFVALSRATLKKKFAIVRTRHVSVPVSNNLTTKWLYSKGCDAIVTTGEKLKATLIRDNGIPADKLCSVATGINPETFSPGDKQLAREQTGLPGDAFVIGIVATLRSWKGHEYLLEAFSNIATPNMHLVLVGGGPQRENLEKQVKQLGLEKQVTFSGNQEDVVPWLRSMDLFVLPSYANEGVPQSMMQAMFSGVPVIGTPVGSVDEILIDNQTGLMVEPRNTQSLQKAILKMMNDETLRNQLSAQALNHVKGNYSFSHMIERMEAIFKESIR
jgi:glycosyltransferase involved in cell wall biosynthesis